MFRLFITSTVAGRAWGERLAQAIAQAHIVEDEDTDPIEITLDEPDLDGDVWGQKLGPSLKDSDLVLVVLAANGYGGYEIEPGLVRTIARSPETEKRLMPVIVDALPGCLADYDLEKVRLRAVPGLAISQHPYNGDEAVWLAATLHGIALAVTGILEHGQRPDAVDVLEAQRDCLTAVQAARDAYADDGGFLGRIWPPGDEAVKGFAAALNAGPPWVFSVAEDLTDDARRLARNAKAANTADALMRLGSCIRDLALGLFQAGADIVLRPDSSAQSIDTTRTEQLEQLQRVATGAVAVESRTEAVVVVLDDDQPLSGPVGEAASKANSSAIVMRQAAGNPTPTIPGQASSPRLQVTRPPRRRGRLQVLQRALGALLNAMRDLAALRRRVPSEVAVRIDALGAAVASLNLDARELIDRVEGYPSMVRLPRGKFMMGSPSDEDGRFGGEGPVHEVTIAYDFAIGRGPVTFAMWDEARAAGAPLELLGDASWGRGNRPVINASWEEAQAYIAWLNDEHRLTGGWNAYRLPSEAEWEYACRAGNQKAFSFGDSIDESQANFVRNVGKTTPVGSYPSNAFGLYDMHGNVWEWCEDPWHNNYKGAPSNGSVWQNSDTSERVMRGGSWSLNPRDLRSAYRSRGDPTGRDYGRGFRLARTLSRSPP